jgi:hypothetical protein
MKHITYKIIPPLLLALACDAPTPSPAPSAPAPAPVARRAELRDGDLQLKFLAATPGALPALERDPVGALRPAWQLLRPRHEGLESSAQVSDLSFGFCATLKERAWFARCDGEGDPGEVRWRFERDGGDWVVTLDGEVALVDWRGQEGALRVEASHKVTAPPADLDPEAWWRALGRALTVDWISRVDALRSGVEPPAIRWSEFRRDPPAFRPTAARPLGTWAFDGRAWLLDLDPAGLARLHRVDERGVPIAQVIQTAPLPLDAAALAAPDPERRRLLLALPGARELDPNQGQGWPALAPLQPGCGDAACDGISLLSVDHRGKILLAGRATEAALAGAPLPAPDGGALVAARLRGGESALIAFARGGLEARRWALPAAAGAWPLAWLDARALALGPVAGKNGAALWRLDAADPKARLQPIPLPAGSVALTGAPLRGDGDGGALVLLGREGASALLHLDPRGATRWERALPLAAGPVTVTLAAGKAWVSAAGGWSALVELTRGDLLQSWDSPLESAPLPWGDAGEALVCRQGRAWWLDAQGAPRAAQPLGWGCRALEKLNDDDILATAGDPGGAYRLAPPERWPAPDEPRR